jgi:5'-3' exonuclease
MQERYFDCQGLTIEQAEAFGSEFAKMQRDIMFWIADLARYSEARWPDTHHQVWPEWISHGMLSRAAGVGQAYPNKEDRQFEATYTQFMQAAGNPNRLELLAAIVDKGLTSDESRKATTDSSRPRWLLAVDVNYHLHRHWFSGAGVEAASQVATWVGRTTARLREKGLTDVACCFDSPRNFRKELTADWEDKYKPRPPKDPELIQQLTLVWELLEGRGFCCVVVDGFEADDVMASAASQFNGRVTLLTQDKDLKQCLSERCNLLLDVEWAEDETSGELLPDYKWLSAKQHTEDTGIRPDQWTAYQAICGDNVDGIKGVAGIGTKGAADLIKEFGTVSGAIQAAKDDDERIKPKKREALIAFEERVDITRQLVTLRTDLVLPANTRI